jgi:tetratricopeptide (TPR) repeat protein
MAHFNLKFLLALSFIFIPAFSFADTVVLKSGKVIEGQIAEQTEQYIKIDTIKGPLYFERKFISEIAEYKERGSSPTDDLLVEALGFAKEGMLENSKISLKKAIKQDPEDMNIKGALGLIEEEEKGSISKDLLMALFSGSLAMIKQQYSQARDCFLRASVLKPDDPDISFNLALAYYNLKDYAKGIDCLKKYILNNPIDADAYALLGTLYYDSGENALAKENFLVAKELFQKSGNDEGLHEANLMLTALFAKDIPSQTP